MTTLAQALNQMYAKSAAEGEAAASPAWVTLDGYQVPTFSRGDFEWRDPTEAVGQQYIEYGDGGTMSNGAYQPATYGGWHLTQDALNRLGPIWGSNDPHSTAFNYGTLNGTKISGGLSAQSGWTNSPDLYDSNGNVSLQGNTSYTKDMDPLDLIYNAAYKSHDKIGTTVEYKRVGDQIVPVSSGTLAWNTTNGDMNKKALMSFAALIAAGYAIPLAAQAVGMAPGAAASAGTSAAEFAAADAAQLAAQGLSQAQIAETLVYSGLDQFVAADVASLASQGMSAEAIVQNTAAAYGPELTAPGVNGYSPMPSVTPSTPSAPSTPSTPSTPNTPTTPTTPTTPSAPSGSSDVVQKIIDALKGGAGGIINSITGGSSSDLLRNLLSSGFLYDSYAKMDSQADSLNDQYKEAANRLQERIDAGVLNEDQLRELISKAPNIKEEGDKAIAEADRLQGLNDEQRAELFKTISEAGDKNEALLAALGPYKTYGEADVDRLTQDIYNKKTGQVDRALALASSQGFADALRRGVSDSTQAADTRDSVVRRFADTYSALDADSRQQATSQVNSLSTLQNTQRSQQQKELADALNPELNARVSTYKPTEVSATTRVNVNNQNVQGQGQLYTALANQSNNNIRAATDLAVGAGKLAGDAYTASGAARDRLFASLVNNFGNTGRSNTGGSGTTGTPPINGTSDGGIVGTIGDWLKKIDWTSIFGNSKPA